MARNINRQSRGFSFAMSPMGGILCLALWMMLGGTQFSGAAHFNPESSEAKVPAVPAVEAQSEDSEPDVSEQSDNQLATSKPENKSLATKMTPRAMLETLGLGDAFFAGFKSGEPVGEAERARIVRLLFRLRQMAPAVLEEAAQASSRDGFRQRISPEQGEIYWLRQLFVRRVVREQLPAELKAKYGVPVIYRCYAETVTSKCLIYALEVPRAWKLDQPIQEQGSAIAMYLQSLPPGDVELRKNFDSEANVENEEEKAIASSGAVAGGEVSPESSEPESVPDAGNGAKLHWSTPLLFVTRRLAWHPKTLAGSLGLDYGLFDHVKNRSGLNEREVFYQMLAMSRGGSPDFLDTQAEQYLQTTREMQSRLVRNRDLPAKMRSEAERILERANAGASDVVPLFNDAANQRGNLVVLRGEALRAVEIRVDEPDILQRFGIDHYYEIEIITPDSQNNPLVCCVTEIPPQMPLGESIREPVRVVGFFLKSWAYDAPRTAALDAGPEAARKFQVAPLIIGKTVEILPRADFSAPTQSLKLAAGLFCVGIVCGVVIWQLRRRDRRAAQSLATHRKSLPEQIVIQGGDGESSTPL